MDQLNIKTRLLTDPVEQTPNPLHKVDRYYKEGNATTLLSTFKRGLLPMKRAPRTCNTGISNGKLNGVIIATWSTPPYTKAWPFSTSNKNWRPSTGIWTQWKRTPLLQGSTAWRDYTWVGGGVTTGPYGQRRPVLCCPAWFPGTAKDLARKRTCSQWSKTDHNQKHHKPKASLSFQCQQRFSSICLKKELYLFSNTQFMHILSLKNFHCSHWQKTLPALSRTHLSYFNKGVFAEQEW